jgi:hypothetical protein
VCLSLALSQIFLVSIALWLVDGPILLFSLCTLLVGFLLPI